MKKIIAFILAAIMCVAFVSCKKGGSADNGTDAATTVPEELVTKAPVTTAPSDETDGETKEALTIWDIISPAEVPDIKNTSWQMMGGFSNGTEMDESTLRSTLDMYGGALQISYIADSTATMVQGNGSMNGTYEIANSNVQISFVNEANEQEYTYIAIFAEYNDSTIMILMTDDTGTNALYFSLIEESGEQ